MFTSILALHRLAALATKSRLLGSDEFQRLR